eukprot:6184534-Pleurochrysis_carterae.AAC.3
MTSLRKPPSSSQLITAISMVIVTNGDLYKSALQGTISLVPTILCSNSALRPAMAKSLLLACKNRKKSSQELELSSELVWLLKT